MLDKQLLSSPASGFYRNGSEKIQSRIFECGQTEPNNFVSTVYREVALEYLKTSSKMVRRILEVLFGNLGVEEEYLCMGAMKVNMNFYPPCPDLELTVGVAPHSDLGILAVLLQDGIGGLHVKINEDEQEESNGEWIEISPIPNALVINVDDCLQVSNH
ncbi:Oxoglutarate/iron-dependent dioxygenase [Macleaya cordata]|uniref:Oxoglutarate/iron-dependent dioxygenase n=1 Tax=Macleaya cordata TaxID=56857 RepID=A0A200Q345_MACCD|nr:Oxoglutarate/iron-dependent dioxygenase [Macleaya cordata]